MDEQNATSNSSVTKGPFTMEAQSKINWLKNNKKRVLITLAAVFLIIFFGITMINTFNTPKGGLPQPTPQISQVLEDASQATMTILTDKDVYAPDDKIKVTIRADSKSQAVRAFDTAINYDPEYVSLVSKGRPLLKDFKYFFSVLSISSVQIAAVLDEKLAEDKFFKDTALFEFDLAIKKPGKTALVIQFAPSSTIDSNILNKESKDILGKAYGKEFEIK